MCIHQILLSLNGREFYIKEEKGPAAGENLKRMKNIRLGDVGNREDWELKSTNIRTPTPKNSPPPVWVTPTRILKIFQAPPTDMHQK